jgi:hypothetical protein
MQINFHMSVNKFLKISVMMLTVVALIILIIAGQIQYAEAQLPGGGFHATIISFCTCSPGYISFIIGAGTTLSGLYYFAPWTIPLDATSMMPGAFWLGYYLPFVGGEMCWMVSGFFCIPPFQSASLMEMYGGSF